MCTALAAAHVVAVMAVATGARSIGGFDYVAGLGSNRPFDTIGLRVGFRIAGDGGADYIELWESLRFSTEDVGRTFTVTANDDFDFPEITTLLTNGANDLVHVGAAGPIGGGGYEQSEALAFYADGSGRSGVDFEAYEIESYSLRVNDLTFQPWGSTGTLARYDITFSAHGRPNVCPEDVDRSGSVGLDDVITVLSRWGACEDCWEDLNRDGVVSVADLVLVLTSWGGCDD